MLKKIIHAMSRPAPDVAAFQIRPGAPCDGCKQPRETENMQFATSDVQALERERDAGCPICPLILDGLEKCLGRAIVSKRERLLFVFNGTGVWDFHVVVGNDDNQTVSFFVSPGKLRLRFVPHGFIRY